MLRVGDEEHSFFFSVFYFLLALSVRVRVQDVRVYTVKYNLFKKTQTNKQRKFLRSLSHRGVFLLSSLRLCF